MEVAVIGSEDFTLGFRLAGIRKVITATKENMEEKIGEVLKDKSIGILVMRNEDMNALSPSLKRSLVESIEPVVIAIGRIEEVDLRERIKQAVGVDLWK